ncbi:MAG: glycosyltransferase family 39 protein [Planctomycetes bacterium]|nr:glycosyltransferase family 39 protein [Planctomycetota bacterium]
MINIAQNLIQGRLQYLAINQSLLLSARFPLFPLLLVGLFKVFGVDIGVLRGLSAGLGILSVALLYWVIRRTQGVKAIPLALVSALLLAIYPQAVLFNRLGFSYNLLAPLVLLCLWGMWEYLDHPKAGWLALPVLSIGLGATSDLAAFTLLPVLILVISVRRWKDLLWSIPLTGLPMVVYSGWMLLIAPQAFLFDLHYLASRLGEIPLVAQIPAVFLNYSAMTAWDAWVFLAVIGFFLLKPERFKRITLLLYFFPLILLGRTVALTGTAYYYIIPLFPLTALGAGALVCYSIPVILKVIRDGLSAVFNHWGWSSDRQLLPRLRQVLSVFGASLAVFLLVVGPLLWIAWTSIGQVSKAFQTPIDWALVDSGGARQVADYLNKMTSQDDLIVASPAIAWLFKAHVADFQMAIAVKGQSTIHFPTNVPLDRFAYDPDYQKARFVVVDRIWRNWASPKMPGVQAMLTDVESWPLEMKKAEYAVYRNPTFPDSMK